MILFVMLTDSTCALYTTQANKIYIWEYCKSIHICSMFKAFEWNSWEICFNGNTMGKYKISAGAGSKLV